MTSLREQAERAVALSPQERAIARESQRDIRDGLSTFDKAVPVAGQLADAVSTVVGLANGLKERNPAMAPIAGNAPLLLVVKAGIGVGCAAMGHVLAKNGHPKTGRALAWLAGAVGFAAAAHNARELRQELRR